MSGIAAKFAYVFGPCVIIASLCSGCATGGPPSRPVANLNDLNYFQPDCKIRDQQIAYLQSLRRTSDDMLFSFSGWIGYDKTVNWTIDNHLRQLIHYC